MTPEGEKLDQFLTETITDWKNMPEIGGSAIGHSLADIIGSARKELDEAKLEIAGVVTEMVEEIKANKSAVILKVRQEQAAARKSFADFLGNEMGNTETKQA